MDKLNAHQSMDELLARLPLEAPAPDLAIRIYQTIQRRRKRSIQVRLSLSVFFALLGLWLVIPDIVAWYETISLPSTGLPMLIDMIQMIFYGVEVTLTNIFSGLIGSQETLSSLGFALPGMLALALSTLLALDYLIPKVES